MKKRFKFFLFVIGVFLLVWSGLVLFTSPFAQRAAAPGDVNVNGRVDCADVTLVRGALGTRNGEPGFLLQADVDRDGVVDQKDLDTVISHLPEGLQCP